MKLRVAHLYPRLMNVYGDRGNILSLSRRCRDRDIEVEVTELGLGDRLDPAAHDLIFIGGAQDREQQRVAEDLRSVKGPAIREAVEAGVVALAVCGGYQLFGRSYREAGGAEIEGLAIFNIWTEHPGPLGGRLIGNVVADWEGSTLVGFENHGGRTYFVRGGQHLAWVRSGSGNNGGDHTEGARYKNAFGTYLHGSLLPKNPRFADCLIKLALARNHGDGIELAPIDDRLEELAHQVAVKLAGGSV